VKNIVQEIIKYGGIRPIWFGFKVQDITPALASSLGLKSADGVIITYIDENGPAEETGLKRGDIIRSIDSQNIKDVNDAEIAVSDLRIGEDIEIEIIRDGKEIEQKRSKLNKTFKKDPLCDSAFLKGSLLHKYKNRALILCSNYCAMHCRFCFRQNLQYQSNLLYPQQFCL